MMQDKDIIYFSNDWDGDPLSKKHVALRLAQKNRLLWVNSTGIRNPTASMRDLRRIWNKLRMAYRGCRPVAENIHAFSPLVIPFHGNRAARWMNRRLLAWSLRRACRKLRFQQPLTYTFVPSSADVVGSLGERLVVYHCVDEYSEFTGANRRAILDLELRLLERADLVVVSSSRLYETKHRSNPNTFLVTHGVDVAHFRTACHEETAVPHDCADLPHPVIGFFGLIADWVDLDVVRSIATARPDWSLLLIGEVQSDTSALRELPNVRILGRRPYGSLPGYCKAFDIAILPFVVNELTLAANPLKLREYLAAGLPVVATPLQEVKKLDGLLRIATSGQDYIVQIEALLNEGQLGPDLARSRKMDSESWDEKVEHISNLIAALPAVASTPRPELAPEQAA